MKHDGSHTIIRETSEREKKLFRKALVLGYATVVYNVAEGIVSMFFGLLDDSPTLFGFGMDSMIETVSAIGIILMIYRIRVNPDSLRTQGEVMALRITGFCFFALAALLGVMVVYNLIQGIAPNSTLPGVIVSIISIGSMLWLIRAKQNLGKALNSPAIIADANCNRVCVYMSIVLLASSSLFLLTGFGFFEVLGTLGIIWFSIREGIEALNKAKGMHQCCCGRDCDGSPKVIN